MVQLGQKGRPFTTRFPYFMENVTTKNFGVGLERTNIGGFGLDSSLVDSDSTQVWWTQLECGGLGLDSSIFKWTRLESQSQMTRLESFNGWTRSNTDNGTWNGFFVLFKQKIFIFFFDKIMPWVAFHTVNCVPVPIVDSYSNLFEGALNVFRLVFRKTSSKNVAF